MGVNTGQDIPSEVKLGVNTGQDIPNEVKLGVNTGQDIPSEVKLGVNTGQDIPSEVKLGVSTGQDIPREVKLDLNDPHPQPSSLPSVQKQWREIELFKQPRHHHTIHRIQNLDPGSRLAATASSLGRRILTPSPQIGI